jgi:hypothetical protein
MCVIWYLKRYAKKWKMEKGRWKKDLRGSSTNAPPEQRIKNY